MGISMLGYAEHSLGISTKRFGWVKFLEDSIRFQLLGISHRMQANGCCQLLLLAASDPAEGLGSYWLVALQSCDFIQLKSWRHHRIQFGFKASSSLSAKGFCGFTMD